MERVWKIGTIFVMAVALIVVVKGGFIDGHGEAITAGAFIFVVALIFNLLGWSGKGLSHSSKR